jgi:CelD/BcsL family acetyltransferase involved in cellulose biosynthesis/glycosyltransferase involved in cell wall biosynthesis
MSELTVLSVAYPMAHVGADSVGGAEQISFQLDEAIVAAGHRSIVVAADGARISGTLVPIPLERGTRDAAAVGRAHAAVMRAIAGVLARERVDVVHMHGIDFDRYLPRLGPPVVVTLHLPPTWYAREALSPLRANVHFCCVSRAQHAALPSWATSAEVFENGVATSAFRPRKRKAGFCLLLARMCPEKGIHDALDAADEAEVPLLIGGDVSPWHAHQRYFDEVVKRRLRPPHRWLGPLGLARKRRLLAAARAVLVPSCAPETSSLVAMEALASGTPVIAYASGALPEIIEHGKTGFIVHDVRSMAHAIARAHEIDQAACRDAAVTRFSSDAMVSRYLALYERVAVPARAAAPPPITTETRHGIDALADLAPAWRRLWERCPTASAFQRPEWLLAYARVFCAPGRGAEPWAIVAEQAGEIVGIAPLCTRGRTTTLLGDGISDYLDVIVDRTCASSATASLLCALAAHSEQGVNVVLDALKASSPLLAAPLPAGCVDEVITRDACPYLQLPAGIDPVPPAMREKVRYYRRRAERLGGVEVSDATGEAARGALETLFALHGARWAARGEQGVLSDSDVRAFLRDAVPALGAAGAARIGELRIGARAAASMLLLRDAWADSYFIGGFDPELASVSPGTLLLAYEIERARHDGRGELDFLRGREPYKYRFGARDRFTQARRLVARTIAA